MEVKRVEMGIKDFWQDRELRRVLTPEERYFYIYLLENSNSNLCGCYKLDISKMSNETGYSTKTIELYLNRFSKVYKKIAFDLETEEILILEYYKYYWWNCDGELINTSGIISASENIVDKDFKNYVSELINKCISGKISNVKCCSTVDNKEKEKKDQIVKDFSKEVISYMNEKCKTRYQYKSEYVLRRISARMKDGFTNIEDYKKVIDKKSGQWLNTDYEKYLRPNTLFGTKFEVYLNERDKEYERRIKIKERQIQKEKQENEEQHIDYWDNDADKEMERLDCTSSEQMTLMNLQDM